MPAQWPSSGDGGGPDATAVHKTGAETITGHKTYERGTTGAALTVKPPTRGIFHDLAAGVHGIEILASDPPSPHWWDSVTNGGTTVYASDVLLAPIPMAAKLTSNTTSSNKLEWSDLGFSDLAEQYGRMYLYLDVNPSSSIRLVVWTATGVSSYLRLNSSTRKLEIQDTGGAVVGTSAVALSAATWYRVEWRVVHGTAGTVQVKVFAGHATSSADDFISTGFNNGTVGIAMQFGNTNSGNLGNKVFRMAAFAGGCETWPGPYDGPTLPVRMLAPDGRSMFEISPNGELLVRSSEEYNIAASTAPKYMVQRGDPAVRVNSRGIWVGPGWSTGNPATVNEDKAADAFISSDNYRVTARGATFKIMNDPPDFILQRINSPKAPGETAFGKAGTGCTITSGNPVATFSDLILTLADRGHGIRINGVDYNIAEILSPTTCTLKPTPTASGSGLSWKIKTAPYPETTAGVGGGGPIGQWKFGPHAFPFITKGTDGVTSTVSNNQITLSGSALANIAEFKVGRHVLIDNNPALAPQLGSFTITAVASPIVTLDMNVLASRANAPWSLAGNDQDDSVQVLQTICNIAGEATSHMCHFSATEMTGSMDMSWNMIPKNVLFDNAGGAMPLTSVFKVKSEGVIECLNGLGRISGQQFYVGGQPMLAAGTHAQRLAATHAPWRMWRETDTGLIYYSDGTAWQIWKGDGIVRKTADETLNNSQTLQSDNDLFFPIEANEIWFVEPLLDVISVSNASDFKAGFAVPAGCTYKIAKAGGTSTLATTGAPTFFDASNQAVGSGNGEFPVQMVAVVTNGATAGTVTLQWAQNTATVEDTKVLTNSLLRIRRLL